MESLLKPSGRIRKFKYLMMILSDESRPRGHHQKLPGKLSGCDEGVRRRKRVEPSSSSHSFKASNANKVGEVIKTSRE
jgi:hypothetical protein